MIEWLAKVQQVTSTLNSLMHKSMKSKERKFLAPACSVLNWNQLVYMNGLQTFWVMYYSILNPLTVFLHLNQEIFLAKLNFYSVFMVKIQRFKPFQKEIKNLMLKSMLSLLVLERRPGNFFFHFKMIKWCPILATLISLFAVW